MHPKTAARRQQHQRWQQRASVTSAARVSNISSINNAHGNAANPPIRTMRDITLVAHCVATGVLTCDAAWRNGPKRLTSRNTMRFILQDLRFDQAQRRR